MKKGKGISSPAFRMQLKLLGYPTITIDKFPLRVRERRAVALLVYLSAAGGPVSREVLSTLLWPEADAETSRVRLRRLLYKIRKASGLDLVESDRSNMWISRLAVLDSDVKTFEQLLSQRAFAQAEPLYTGDFLEGFHLDAASEMEEWIFFRREALKGRLVHALERLIQEAFERGRNSDAARYGARLVECDPLNEAAHRHLIKASMENGDLASARRHYQFCADLLKRTLGVSPAEATRKALEPRSPPASSAFKLPVSPVRYVSVDDLHVAYRTVGDGETDVLLVPGFVSHVERLFDDRHCFAWIERVASCGRLILFDRRGVGLSDRASAHPTPEAVARDMEAVLDAVGSRKAIVIGASEGGPGSIFFAVRFPQRVHKLILWGAMAKGCRSPDYPYALDRQHFDVWLERITKEWGGPIDLSTFAPSLLQDAAAQQWWASLLRAASSPGSMRTILTSLRDVDVRPLLTKLTVPTTLMHRRGDRAVKQEASIYMAETIPGARLVLLDGDDHWFWIGDRAPLLAEIAATTSQGLLKGRSL